MNVFFRVDASPEIGSGHFFRCLALAGALADKGSRINFICRSLNESFKRSVEGNGWSISCINNDPEDTVNVLHKAREGAVWVVTDNYGLDTKWEKTIRPFADKVMVIDDLGEREHLCDIFLDQNADEDLEGHYKRFLPAGCTKLFGPKYALLRKEFSQARDKGIERNGEVKNILVFFGGGDLGNVTKKIVEGILLLKRKDISVKIVVGADNPHKTELDAIAADNPSVSCRYNIDNMAQVMLESDLYIGASGITTWERCCLGLPSLVITAAGNQMKIIRYMAKKNYLGLLGDGRTITSEEIKNKAGYYLAHPEILKGYSRASYGLVDGLGAQRCAEIMMLQEGHNG